MLSQWKIQVNVTMSEKLLIEKYSGSIATNYLTPATETTEGGEAG